MNEIPERRCSLSRRPRRKPGSVADHPRTRGRKAFPAAPGLLHQACRLSRTTPATRCMRRLVFGYRLGRVGTALVGSVGLALVRRHAEESRRRQYHPRRFTFTLRTVLRRIAFRHRPHIREWTAILAEIFIDRHFIPSRVLCPSFATADAGRQPRAVPHPVAWELYLSGDSDTSRPPLTCFIGPADDGMISKSKISVGRYSVAQAFGMSTTPLIWPCTGATPRIV
jgi:hypothetical protein